MQKRKKNSVGSMANPYLFASDMDFKGYMFGGHLARDPRKALCLQVDEDKGLFPTYLAMCMWGTMEVDLLKYENKGAPIYPASSV